MANWSETTLDSCVSFTKGVTYAAADYADKGQGHPFLTIKSVKKGGGFNEEGLKYYKGPYKAAQAVNEGDLLIALTDLTRAGDIIGGPFRVPELGVPVVLPSMDLAVLREGDEPVDFSFLSYRLMLQDARQYMLARSAGTTVLHLDSKAALKFPFLKPRPKSQEHIADILSTVDEAIEQTELLIAKTQQIKAGMMHDLTRGVTPDGQLRPPREETRQLYKESPLGWIPNEWQHEPLDSLARRGSGHTPNRNIPSYWNGGIKWISLADSYRLDQLYIDDTENEISEAGIQNSSAVLHPAGIVVLSRDAGVGKSAITTEPMAVSQHFMCWRCDERLDKHFLYYWLQYKKRMFENIAVGTTILTIGLPFFRKLKITAPTSPDEQRQIGDILRTVDHEIFELKAEIEKRKKQKVGLMKDLLTGDVSLPIDQNDAKKDSQ